MKLIINQHLLLLAVILVISGGLSQNNLGFDPDVELDGDLIEDGPANTTNATHPNIVFSSALDLPSPHTKSTESSTVNPLPASPTSAPTSALLPQATGTTPSPTTPGQVQPTMNPQNSSAPLNAGATRLLKTNEGLVRSLIAFGLVSITMGGYGLF